MKDYRIPYLAVADPRLMMKGPNAPRSTVFGALGIGGGAGQFVGGGSKSLGGLVADTKKHGPMGDLVVRDSAAGTTEHGRFGKDATKLPARHSGQVPYAGAFYGTLGKTLS